jgi:hypothetical protein
MGFWMLRPQKQLFVCLLSAAACLLTPRSAAAQAPVQSFPAASGLISPGQAIVIVQNNGNLVSGRFIRAGAQSITVQRASQQFEVSATDVKEIRAQRHPIGWVAVPIAAGIGFAAGYAVGACHHSDCADNFGPLVGLIGAGIAAPAGLAVHLAVTRETLLYTAPAPTTRLNPSRGVMSDGLRAVVLITIPFD